MKTNYNKIKKALAEVDEARADLNRVASLRVGMISGGPDINDEREWFERAVRKLRRLIRQAIENNCRLSYLLEVVDGEITVTPMVQDAIDEKEHEMEWRSQ